MSQIPTDMSGARRKRIKRITFLSLINLFRTQRNITDSGDDSCVQ